MVIDWCVKCDAMIAKEPFISTRSSEQIFGHEQAGGRLALRFTTATLEDAPGLQGTRLGNGLEAARLLASLYRRLRAPLAVVPLAGDRP